MRSAVTTRYLCLDFETNGFPKKGGLASDRPYPWCSFPIQLAVVIVEDGEIIPAYDTVIRGATQLAPFVRDKVPVTMNDIRCGVWFNEMLNDLAALIQPGDVLVAHNARFDLDDCLHTSAIRYKRQKGYPLDEEALTKILRTPTFCTMKFAWTVARWPRGLKMKELCDHFQVDFEENSGHDARYDALKLAECVQEALRTGSPMMNSARMDAYQERPAFSRLQTREYSPRRTWDGRAPVSDASGSREPVVRLQTTEFPNRWESQTTYHTSPWNSTPGPVATLEQSALSRPRDPLDCIAG